MKFLLKILLFFTLTYCFTNTYSQCSLLELVADTNSGCAPLTVRFAARNFTPGSTFSWDFGSGFTFPNTADSVKYNLYKFQGSYSVKLTVVSPSNVSCTINKNNFIKINGNVNVNLIITNKNLCSKYDTLVMIDSTLNVAQREWVIDGVKLSDTGQKIKYLFNSIGYKQVSIKIKTKDGCFASQILDSVIQVWDTVLVGFNASKYSGCPPMTCDFVPIFNLNGQTVRTYTWSLPGGLPSTSSIQYPKTIYNNSGNYDVTLSLKTNTGCVYSYKKAKAITVFTKPKIQFLTDKPVMCLSDTAFATASITKGLLKRVEWIFNPNVNILDTTMTSDSIHYNVPNGANYGVQIKCYYDDCIVDTIVSLFNKVNELKADFDANYKTLCLAPDTVTFFNQTFSNPGKNIKYKWYFYDSTGSVIDDSSTQANPTKIYKGYGRFKVKLVATDDTCVSVNFKEEFIKILPPDSIKLQATPNKTCTGEKVSFNSQNTGFSDKFKSKYLWKIYTRNFDSLIMTDTAVSPKLVFNDTGTYAAILIAYNTGGCSDTAKDSAIVRIELPKATFTVDTPAICLGQSVSLESFPVTKFKTPYYGWYIRHHDSNNVVITMVGQKVSLSPPKPGYYDVYHIYGTGSCKDTSVLKNAFVVNGLDVKAQINYTQSCVPLTFTVGSNILFDFHNGVASSKIGYYWTSDHGGVFIDQPDSPFTTVNMTQSGCFKVSLQVWNSAGCRVNYPDVFKGCAGLYSNFKLSSLTPCINDTVYVNNKSGLSVKYKWKTNNPANVIFIPNDSAERPQLIFLDTGIYKISLIAFSQAGCTDTATYTVKPKKIFVDFYSPDTNKYCGPITATFYVNSLNNDYYKWDFGDGSAPIEGWNKSVSHVYDIKNGKNTFDVKFTAVESNGCSNTIIKKDYIRINGPVPSFSFKSNIGCGPLQVSIINTSKNCKTSYLYNDIGNLDSSGNNLNYTYTLLNKNNLFEVYKPYMFGVDSNYGCKKLFQSTDSIVVYQRPKAQFSISDTVACAKLKINFKDSSFAAAKYFWDFDNNGTVDDTNANPSHTYTIPGVYSVKLKIINVVGCEDSLILNNAIRVTDTPNFDFQYNGQEFCFGNEVAFNLLKYSNAQITKLLWDFGDSQETDDTSSLYNPTYTYKNDGLFSIKLYIETEGKCNASYQKDTIIRVLLKQPIPSVNILNVTDIDNQDIKVTWAKCPSIYFKEYNVYRKSNSVNTLLYTTSNINDTNYIDKNANINNTYYEYEVVVIDRCYLDTIKNLTHNNILLSIDTLGKNTNILSWRPYSGWQKLNSKATPHTVFRATNFNGPYFAVAMLSNDSIYIDSNLCDSLYFYYVSAASPFGRLISISNIDSEHPNYQGPDTPVYLNNVTVIDNSYLHISWVTFGIWDKTNQFFLLKQYGNGPYTIYQRLKEPSFDDKDVDINKTIYHYKIVRQDQCLIVGPQGNKGNNIVLNGYNKNDITYLNWNSYENWKLGVRNYIVQLYNYSSNTYDDIDTTTDTSYIDSLIHNYTDSDFCYRVVAVSNEIADPTKSTSNSVCVKLPARVFFPNSFTPNNDKLNDVFKPTISFVHGEINNDKLKYRFMIFDRWGEKLFETSDPQSGWDGKINGKPAETGVYIYSMEAVSFIDLIPIIKSGSFHLLR